jgi:predicted RNA-binding Zn-ribbon protein involved in translation (DUF1610 family)
MEKIPEKCPKCGSSNVRTWIEKIKAMQCKGHERWFECLECGFKTIV